MPTPNNPISIRSPEVQDGAHAWRLISACPPLDTNSLYCNLLQCSHFSGTSAIAEQSAGPVGFIAGYLIPERENTLFIWQVAVSDAARGEGLATRMLEYILSRPLCNDVCYLETTITPDNQASWALFEGIADKLRAGMERSILFDKEEHFAGTHDSENLLRIGPFNVNAI
jgi:L-2,4-diaminobutyric acid acetyltransferase